MKEVNDITLKRILTDIEMSREKLTKEREQLQPGEKSRLLALTLTHLETASLFLEKAEQL